MTLRGHDHLHLNVYTEELVAYDGASNADVAAKKTCSQPGDSITLIPTIRIPRTPSPYCIKTNVKYDHDFASILAFFYSCAQTIKVKSCFPSAKINRWGKFKQCFQGIVGISCSPKAWMKKPKKQNVFLRSTFNEMASRRIS